MSVIIICIIIFYIVTVVHAFVANKKVLYLLFLFIYFFNTPLF